VAGAAVVYAFAKPIIAVALLYRLWHAYIAMVVQLSILSCNRICLLVLSRHCSKHWCMLYYAACVVSHCQQPTECCSHVKLDVLQDMLEYVQEHLIHYYIY
jgi:hypothetical protein